LINTSEMILETIPGYETLRVLWNFLMTIFVILDAALIFGFVYSLIKGWTYRPPIEIPEPERTKKIRTLAKAIFEERWQAILKKASPASPDSLRLAVIEADSLVNDVLGELGFGGKHLADRLANLNPDEYKTLNALWRAHRIRNDLVHTPGFFLSPEDAQKLLSDYEAFLKEIEVI
jgi:hypothetical protein